MVSHSNLRGDVQYVQRLNGNGNGISHGCDYEDLNHMGSLILIERHHIAYKHLYWTPIRNPMTRPEPGGKEFWSFLSSSPYFAFG
jgi:hypothetical protein